MAATLKVFEYENRKCIGIGVDGSDHEVVADVWDAKYAKVFAAAPELLEALQSAQKSLAMFVTPEAIKDTSVLVTFTYAKQAESQARAAIAKATT